MDAGVAYFPTHDAVPPGELARLVEARGHRWLMFAEHTHIPASRETPWSGARARRRCRASTRTPTTCSSRWRRRGGDVGAAGRQRHLPGDRARPDHHREGGREHRPPLRRAGRLRRRRGLEPRGDGQPRHGPAHADAAHARARRGDEGDLGAATRRATTASSCHFDRIWSLARSRCSGRTRRSRRRRRADGARPRARVRRRVDAEPPRRRRVERIAELRERAGRRDPGRGDGRARRSRGAASDWRRPASTACCSGCRRRGSAVVERELDAVERAMDALTGGAL